MKPVSGEFKLKGDTVYIGLKAIARRMGVSPSTIRRWHKKHGFPMHKIRADEAAKLAAERSKTQTPQKHH